MVAGINIAGMGNMALGWLSSLTFWAIICVVLVISAVGALYWKKRRGFDKPVLECFDLSPAVYLKNGEIDWSKSLGIFDFRITKGGWFKHKWTMGGLWDYGKEKLFRLKDMTPVFDVSHNDYRKINGKNGLVVIRNANDPKFVIPISKFSLSPDAKKAIAEIAPVDLRNAATASIEQVDHEMNTKWEKWAPIITIAIVAFILIFSILLITQYGKHNVDKTAETLQYAVDAMKGVAVPSNVLPSGAP